MDPWNLGDPRTLAFFLGFAIGVLVGPVWWIVIGELWKILRGKDS